MLEKFELGLFYCWIKFKRWIRNEPKGFWKTFDLLVRFTICIVVWCKLVSIAVFPFLNAQDVILPTGRGITDFLVVWFFLALVEEAFFRWIPLVIGLSFLKKRSVFFLLLISTFSSIIFGFVHIPNYLQQKTPEISLVAAIPLSLFVQGVLGFALSILFIKCADRNDTHLKLKAFLVTTTAHFLYNMLVGGFSIIMKNSASI